MMLRNCNYGEELLLELHLQQYPYRLEQQPSSVDQHIIVLTLDTTPREN